MNILNVHDAHDHNHDEDTIKTSGIVSVGTRIKTSGIAPVGTMKDVRDCTSRYNDNQGDQCAQFCYIFLLCFDHEYLHV